MESSIRLDIMRISVDFIISMLYNTNVGQGEGKHKGKKDKVYEEKEGIGQ